MSHWRHTVLPSHEISLPFLLLFYSQTLTPTSTYKPYAFWETKNNVIFQYSSDPRGDWKSSCLPSGKTDSVSPAGKRGLWRSVWRDSGRHLRRWKWRNQSSCEGNVALLTPRLVMSALLTGTYLNITMRKKEWSWLKRWLGEGRSLSVATEITVLFPFPAKVLLWTVTSEVTNSLRPAESFSLQIYSKRTAVLGARADGKYFRLASQMVSVLAMQPWHCSVKSATVNMWMNGCRCVPVKLYL